MNRRKFMGKAGCSFAGLMSAPLIFGSALSGEQQTPPPKPPKYKLEIEIYEARPDSWCHKKGDKFSYPQDIGKLCPWLLGSLRDFLTALNHGAVLPWKYEKTPYEKVIDPNGVTTEFVRCPDPTSNLVAKITRTKLG
ncbi:MAG: hypothetical protein MUP52_03920 [Candidatus Aminicenantes bacterium]|nr:hypothetical protein [Candidatus Aminicenantes bacterium]